MRTWPVLLVVLVTSGVGAQVPAPITIAGAPTCGNCSVRMDRVLTLSAPPSAEAFKSRTSVARNARGQYVVAPSTRDRLLLFNEQGTYVREIGRPGDGPGEFRNISRVVFGPGDSMLVTEGRLRMHVFSPALTHVRTKVTPQMQGPAFPLADGSVVAWTSVNASTGDGQPVRVIGADGAVVRSFGAVGPRPMPIDPWRCCERSVDPGASGQVLISVPNRYAWRQWSVSGTAGPEYVVRGSPWFKEWTTQDRMIQANAPLGTMPVLTSINTVYHDTPTMQLVFGWRSPPNWRPLPPARDTGPMLVRGGVVINRASGGDASAIRHNRNDRQTVVDVIDLSQRAVIATGFFDGVIFSLGNRFAASYRVTDPDDEIVIDIYRITVVRP